MVVMQPDMEQQNPFQLYEYFFNTNTAGVSAGTPIPLFTPDPGAVVMDAFFVVETAFNGTTPKADIGYFDEASPQGVFATLGSGAVSLAAAATVFGPGTKVTSEETVRIVMPNPPETGISQELMLVVNETGALGGTPSGSTQGAAAIYVVVAKPQNINPTDPALPSL